MNYFSKLTSRTGFPICYNLLPHFASGEGKLSTHVKFVENALADGRSDSFFLSDQPTRPHTFSSLQLAEEIIAAGGESIVALALTFYNREAAFKRLREYYQAGVHAFLFVSGNYPSNSGSKPANPIFDLDSVQLLMLLENLEETKNISKGCVVSPFKSLESEQVWQYEKLRRKISVGADFVITQLGYDIRKFDELIRFCAQQKIDAPLVANISVTDLQLVELIKKRYIPGVKIPGPLLEILKQEANKPQVLQKNRISRAAKTLCILKGLGYHGTLIGSLTPDFSEMAQILDEMKGQEDDWQGFLAELDYSGGSFYYFQKDKNNGLNTSEPAPVAPKHFPRPMYSFSYFVDSLVYVPQGPMFKMTGRFCHFSSSRKFWHSFLWSMEYLSKGPLYGCKMCGDCTLYACGFLCYQSGCPKKIVNGPCGGSVDGYCEVFPEKKKCFWGKVYNNMKGVRQHVTFVAPPIPARDAALDRTSSWINFFMGKDHRKMEFEDE